MCRYAMKHPYKRHFACFDCRKGFKRAAVSSPEEAAADLAPCPDCGHSMADMGLDFKPPRRADTEHWAVAEFLFQRGFTHHGCGCGGCGVLPSRWPDVPGYLESHHCRSAGEVLAAKFAARQRG